MMSVGDPLNRQTFAGFSRHFWSCRVQKDRWNELVWVNRWYNPEDNRSIAPVQRHKFLEQPVPSLHKLPNHWVPESEPPIKLLSRAKEEKSIHVCAPSTHCEQWSTLRQMLPSKGHCEHQRPPKWGTDLSHPPPQSARRPKRFPHINSSMTNDSTCHIYLPSTGYEGGILRVKRKSKSWQSAGEPYTAGHNT